MLEPKKKKGFNFEIVIGGISDVEILLFTKHLSITIKSGLTLVDGLRTLLDQARGRMRKVLDEIYETVKSGKTFHESLMAYPKYFSSVYVNMVKTGELSGTLPESLAKLASQLEKTIKLKKKIKGAMVYPAMIFVAIFGLGMSIALFVLPKILPLFKSLDVELPATTRGLIWFAEFVDNYTLEIIIGSVAGIIFLIWFFKLNAIKPVLHRFFLLLPGIRKIIIGINLERFCGILGVLLESGLTVDQSLKITADAMENRVYKGALEKVIPEVESGRSLQSALIGYPRVFPMLMSRMIGVGEQTGNLSSNLKYLADFYEEEVDDMTKNLSTIIEPFLLIFIGGVVGLVAISILGPIYEITGNVSG